MTQTRPCRHVSTTQPRLRNDRHLRDCNTSGCPGCEPCEPTYGHCRCGRHLTEHEPRTCARCVGHTRDDLTQIETACADLPGEATHRGVNSEAAMLAGPSADPAAWGRRASRAMLGRIPADYLEDCRDELHPLWVLGTWEMCWRRELGHHTEEPLTIDAALDYLRLQLTYMAQRDEPDFDQFATEIRQCRSHLQAVLHDQNRGDLAGVGCFDCGGDLERRLTTSGLEDVWTCQRCRRRYTPAEYNFALRARLEERRESA